jgi:malate dehydrogenase (oxaloacetate-decarboxylating)(NADP+)
MEIAAVQALRKLAHEAVPAEVLQAYGIDALGFGRNYIIPKPFDPRLIDHVPPAVAKAAIDSGVARIAWPDHYPAMR